MRLNRFLARVGLASRRKAEEIIIAGEVSVNGRVVKELATEIDPISDNVQVDGRSLRLPQYKYYALNKPAGYTCTRADIHAEHTVFELLPDDKSLITVGRLDRDTTGLILVTNDGQFAQNIIHPSNKIRKTYVAVLKSPVTKADIEKLRRPLNLDDGPVIIIEAEQVSRKEMKLVIEEGRKRIVRRIFESIGNKVEKLERTQIGGIVLDTKQGEFRELTKAEVNQYV